MFCSSKNPEKYASRFPQKYITNDTMKCFLSSKSAYYTDFWLFMSHWTLE